MSDELKNAATVLGRKGGSVKSPKKAEAMKENGKKVGQATSEAKAEAARENGKKGGRRQKDLEMRLVVQKNGKPRVLELVNTGKSYYELYIRYPNGQSVKAQHQDTTGHIPDIKNLALKNGFAFFERVVAIEL
jgi:hypothetical protein